MNATPKKTVDEIRARWAATTQGPWFWWGNTDSHTVALCGRQPGLGVAEVLSTIGVERDPNGREAQDIRYSLTDVTDMDEGQIEDYISEWAWEDCEDGIPRKDTRLAVTDENYHRQHVNDVAVYQVARNQGLPDDTPRDHPKVYRADVCDVRLPNARALASAWSDVHALLDEVDRLRSIVRAQS